MDYTSIFLSIAAVQLLGAASPGPNFIIVTSYSIGESRRRGLLVVCGILLGTLSWAILAACGLGVLIAHFPSVYAALQLASAGYLIWLGGKMLTNVVRNHRAAPVSGHAPATSAWQAVRTGFLTNMTNPKSIAYYSSLFGVVIPPDAPSWLLAAAVGTALLVSAAWWISVAMFFAVARIRRSYERARRAIDAVLGGALIVVGVRLAISAAPEPV